MHCKFNYFRRKNHVQGFTSKSFAGILINYYCTKALFFWHVIVPLQTFGLYLRCELINQFYSYIEMRQVKFTSRIL